jgi:hypothetical protein
MGTVVGKSAASATHVTERLVDGKIVELDQPEPFDCQALNDAWTVYTFKDNGYWIQNSKKHMRAPSGGLYGSVSIINVAKGTMFSYNAAAINGFADKVGTLHQVPGTPLPSLNSGNIKTASIFLGSGEVFDSPEFDRGVDAVSFVFMHDNLMNNYNVTDITRSDTEWVITFPTKSFYVDEDVADLPFDVVEEEEIPYAIPPFTELWDGDGACEPVRVNKIWDREEQSYSDNGFIPPLVSPSVPDGEAPAFELCWETNVIQFSEDTHRISPIFGSRLATYLNPDELDFEAGWVRLGLYEMPDGDVREGLGGLAGLPAVGISASTFLNGYLTEGDQTILATYNQLFNHKSTRAPDCENFELDICLEVSVK